MAHNSKVKNKLGLIYFLALTCVCSFGCLAMEDRVHRVRIINELAQPIVFFFDEHTKLIIPADG